MYHSSHQLLSDACVSVVLCMYVLVMHGIISGCDPTAWLSYYCCYSSSVVLINRGKANKRIKLGFEFSCHQGVGGRGNRKRSSNKLRRKHSLKRSHACLVD